MSDDLDFKVNSDRWELDLEALPVLALPCRFLGYADSGVGKTVAAALAPVDMDLDLNKVWSGELKPVGDPTYFAIAAEANGLATMKIVNPQMKFPEWDDGTNTCTNMEQTMAVLKMARSGRLTELFGVERLVIDGWTELQMQLLDDMYPDGPPADIDWGSWNDRCRRMLRYVRNIPMDVYSTALEQQRTAKNKPTVTVPLLQGRQVPNEIMGYFDAVGRFNKGVSHDSTGRLSARRTATFTTDRNTFAKPCRSLGGTLKPCMGAWADHLRGSITIEEIRSDAIPTPPEESSPSQAPIAARR